MFDLRRKVESLTCSTVGTRPISPDPTVKYLTAPKRSVIHTLYMKTQDYLKTANDNLKQAIQSCQAEIEDIRRLITNRDQEVKNYLSDLKQQEAARLTEAARTDSDQQTALHMNDARQLRVEETRVENDFKKQKQELDQRLVLMQRALNDFNQISQQIDRHNSQIYQTYALF